MCLEKDGPCICNIQVEVIHQLHQDGPYWEEFKQYKLSKEAQEKSEQAKTNASKKKYTHHLGAGGYKKAVKK